MAKLTRKSAKVFAEQANAAVGGIAQFGSLAAGNIQYSKDVDVIQALDAYKEGWASAVVGNKSPAMEDRNALDYLLSYQQAYIMQRGIPEWLSTETYYIGSVVSSASQIYISLTDNNIGNQLTDTANWRKFYTPTEIDAFLANKSNIALDNVTATGKENSLSWGLLDYTAGITVQSPTAYSLGSSYIAPSKGIIMVYMMPGDNYTTFTVNGNQACPDKFSTTNPFSINYFAIVDTGDEIIWTASVSTGMAAMFYPYKGV